MKTTFKSVCAVLLSALLLVFTAAPAFALSDEQVYHIVCITDSEHVHVVPINIQDEETNNYFVHEDETFEFWVKVDEGYSDKHIIVEIDGNIADPNVHNVYKIDHIAADHEVKVYFDMDDSSSNMMSSLMILLHNIIEWFQKVLGFFGINF